MQVNAAFTSAGLTIRYWKKACIKVVFVLSRLRNI